MPQAQTTVGIFVVTGATASGKTEIAARLAEEFDAEVVGADSRQVYRQLDVGTAKPSPELRARIRHHLVDVVDPDAAFDVAGWLRLARRAIEDIAGRAKRVIVCGGTGLYVRSLTRGLFEGPGADPALRDELEAIERRNPGALHSRLAAVDPAAAARIHPNDRVRLIRALEVWELTGQPLSEWHRAHALRDERFASCTVEICREPDELRRRICDRSREIVANGIVDELARLRSAGYARELRAFQAIGYREAGLCLDGVIPPSELVDAVTKATWDYARRQRIWNRGQLRATQVAADDPAALRRLAEGFFDRLAKRQGIG